MKMYLRESVFAVKFLCFSVWKRTSSDRRTYVSARRNVWLCVRKHKNSLCFSRKGQDVFIKHLVYDNQAIFSVDFELIF